METISDLASKCIRCGFCLEACPTFGLSGDETESPRGRIYLIRTADAGLIPWGETREPLDHCLGCRACESACPSGVEYGKLLELARERLAPSARHRAILFGITRPLLFSIAARLRGIRPPRTKPIPRTRAAKGEVLLLEGCAMRVLYPHVHAATRRLLAKLGYGTVDLDLGCCGALEGHGGLLEQGVARASRIRELAENRPIITNSAGCGCWLKEQQVGKTWDVSEFLWEEGLHEHLRASNFRATVTYHDACHLAHGQKIRQQPRDLLKAIPGVTLVELTASERCCGSAGTYHLLHPDTAKELVSTKWNDIEATGAEIVVQGNPGCHSWLDANKRRGVRVAHLAEILDEALGG